MTPSQAPRYMTPEVVAFIEAYDQPYVWPDIHAALIAAGLPAPKRPADLKGIWNLRDVRSRRGAYAHVPRPKEEPAETGIAKRRCLQCRATFQPDHRFNFLCARCANLR